MYAETFAYQSRGGVDDQVLDKLCRYKEPRPLKSRTSYSKDQHFPILGHRLAAIQDDIDHLQLTRITALWRDRRDLSRWYTFWAVLIIGGIGNVLSAIQTCFTIIQAVYAIKAFRDNHSGGIISKSYTAPIPCSGQGPQVWDQCAAAWGSQLQKR